MPSRTYVLFHLSANFIYFFFSKILKHVFKNSFGIEKGRIERDQWHEMRQTSSESSWKTPKVELTFPRDLLKMTVCYYNVTYTFESESTLYSCLHVKEILARNRRNTWSLSDSNEIRTHNHLVLKRTLKQLG